MFLGRSPLWQIIDVIIVALMSKSLEMFSLCRIALVDVGQLFLCNRSVITKGRVAQKEKKQKNRVSLWLFNPDWKSCDPAVVPVLMVPSAEGKSKRVVLVQSSDTCDSGLEELLSETAHKSWRNIWVGVRLWSEKCGNRENTSAKMVCVTCDGWQWPSHSNPPNSEHSWTERRF